MGLLLGLMLLAYPAYLGYRATKLPAIADITTDPDNPPRFDVLARLRPRGRNDYPGGAVAAAQRAAYPDIVPLQDERAAQTRLRHRARAGHQAQMARSRRARRRRPAAATPSSRRSRAR